MEVTTPTLISEGAKMSRASKSLSNRKMAPAKALTGSRTRLYKADASTD